MTIGIIAAMSKELKLILPLLTDVKTETHHSTTFHVGTLNGHRVVAMECGIGKVNAAIGAITLIDTYSPDLVINSGVAAGAGDNVAVMDTVVATELAHHDFWCIGEEWGHVPGSPKFFPTKELPLPTDHPGLKRGLIVSGELFISSAAEVDAIKGHFPDVMAIDMESAAIAQACNQRGVPFFCMRLISDTPWCSHDNSAQYEDFWEDAPRHSFHLLREILISL